MTQLPAFKYFCATEANTHAFADEYLFDSELIHDGDDGSACFSSVHKLLSAWDVATDFEVDFDLSPSNACNRWDGSFTTMQTPDCSCSSQ